jgi:hypothetical protein
MIRLAVCHLQILAQPTVPARWRADQVRCERREAILISANGPCTMGQTIQRCPSLAGICN